MRKHIAGLLAVILAGAAAMVVPARSAVAATPGVLLVGDSVMAAFNFGYGGGGLGAISSGYTVTLQAAVCRRLTSAGCLSGGTPSSALQVLQSYRGRLPRTVVMTVGYNERDNMAAKVDTIMREATTYGATRVIWLTYQNVRNPSSYAAPNAALAAAPARWPQLTVADWRAYSAGWPSWFNTSDGVHLTSSGATAYGQLIRANLDRFAAPPPPPPPDPRCDPNLAAGNAAPPAVVLPANPLPAGARVTSLKPVRLADTRPGPRLGPGRTFDVTIAGVAGVPSEAVGAIVNLTAVDPCAPGYLTAYPSGSPNPPVASSSNFRAGQVIANLAMVRLGTNGAITVLSSAQNDVLVDLVGYLHPTQGSLVNAIDPVRIHDTRPSAVPAGWEIAVMVGGAKGAIPASPGVTAAWLNVAVDDPAAAGYLTLYPGPCNPANRPEASTLNYAPGQTIANLAVAGVGADGTVCIYTSGAAKVIVDATAWNGSTGGGVVPVTPQRLVDTRPGAAAIHAALKGRIQTAPLEVPAGASSGVPPAATAVVVNVTVVGPVGPGWLTAFPCGVAAANTSSVNYAAFDVRPNQVAIRIGAGEKVCLSSSALTDVIVDLAGWVT